MSDRVIAGRYRLLSKLGEGAMGAVWRAQHLTLGSPVAVKLIEESIAGHEEIVARFEREAQAAAALRSPHVVQILDYGVDEATPFLVMELLEGESLADRLERVGRLSPAETVRVISHVARAISKAHDAGIVHRDLKPDNVFLVHNDDEEVAKVLDFGIAKTTTPMPVGRGTQTGTMIGTPYYMSPEQAEGKRHVDGRSDTWALGVIAYECLCGARPFEGESLGEIVLQICARPKPVPSEVAPVSTRFDAWFDRATERDASQRFQTAKELADALRDALSPDDDRAGGRTVVDGSRPVVVAPAKAGVASRDGAFHDTVEVAPIGAGVKADGGPPRARRRAIALAVVAAVGVAGVALAASRGGGAPAPGTPTVAREAAPPTGPRGAASSEAPGVAAPVPVVAPASVSAPEPPAPAAPAASSAPRAPAPVPAPLGGPRPAPAAAKTAAPAARTSSPPGGDDRVGF